NLKDAGGVAAADGDHVARVGIETRLAARDIDRAGGVATKDRSDLVDDRLLTWIHAGRGDFGLRRRGRWRDPGDRLRIRLERPAQRARLTQWGRADKKAEGRQRGDGPKRDSRRARAPPDEEALPADRALR